MSEFIKYNPKNKSLEYENNRNKDQFICHNSSIDHIY